MGMRGAVAGSSEHFTPVLQIRDGFIIRVMGVFFPWILRPILTGHSPTLWKVCVVHLWQKWSAQSPVKPYMEFDYPLRW